MRPQVCIVAQSLILSCWTQYAYSEDESCPGITTSEAMTPEPGADPSLKEVAECVCDLEGQIEGLKAKKDAGNIKVATLHEYACWEVAIHIKAFNAAHPTSPATQAEEDKGKEGLEAKYANDPAKVLAGSGCMVLITTNETWKKGDEVKEYLLIEELIHMDQPGHPLTDPNQHSSPLLQRMAHAYAEARAKSPQITKAASDLHAATDSEKKKELADALEVLMLDYRAHLKKLCEDVESEAGQALASGTQEQQEWYERWKCCKIMGRDHFNNTIEWRDRQSDKPGSVIPKSKLPKLTLSEGFETK